MIWADQEQVLVQQYGVGGCSPHKALHEIGYVRAVGDYAAMRTFQNKAVDAVRAETEAAYEAERCLGAARDSMWAKLAEIGATVPRLHSAAERQDG